MIPLSYAQHRLWMLEQLHRGSTAYHVTLALRLRGQVQVDPLRQALYDVVARHESLRTVFPMTDGTAGTAHQLVLDPAAGAPSLTIVQCTEAELSDRMAEQFTKPFDLATETSLRPVLFVLGPSESVLLLVLHHIATDGWSMSPLVRDLTSAYEARCGGTAPQWSPLPVQYADYTVWQRDLLGSEDDPSSVISEQLKYWTTTLSGAPQELALPTDRPRPAQPGHQGGLIEFQLGPGPVQALRELARSRQATLFMVLQAALLTVLSRSGAGHDLVVGTPIAGRTDEGLEDLVGCFVNTLALRTDASGNPTFAELLDRVRETDLAAYAHQDLPFERLVEVLNPPRALARHPVFQVSMVLQSNAPARLELAGLEVDAERARNDVAKFDLTAAFAESLDADGSTTGIDGNLEYSCDLYDADTAQGLADRLVRVLAAVAADPAVRVDEIELLSAAERETILNGWNDTAVEFDDDVPVHELIERSLRGRADEVVLVFEGEQLTGAELNRRADEVARVLAGAGVGSRVGLCLQRSVELVVGLLGILKAGAAYVPLDPTYPDRRLEFMVADAGIEVVLAHGATLDRVPAGPTVVRLDAELPASTDVAATAGAGDGAYVIYTSGSTGQPKGVPTTHRAIVNRLEWMQREYRLDGSDVVLQKTPFSFDVSVWEFLWPLLAGARLVVARPEGHRDPAYLAGLIQAEGVTTLHFVPSMLAVFSEAVELSSLTSLRRVVCSGEALSGEVARRFLKALPGRELFNLYGPTEAAIDVSHWTCSVDDEAAMVPIGRPVANTQLYVLDSRGEPVPVGVPGELYIGGVQVAEGYLNRPELTERHFVADPWRGGRLYRTGDLARWRRDGVIEFLGRLDHQIKLRGFRIELGEVEAAVRAVTGVRDAVVVGRDNQLLAYVVGDGVTTTELRAELSGVLPEYMVPTRVCWLDELPLSANGKVDRSKLPAPGEASGDDGPKVTARDGLELALTALWEELLERRNIGVTDDFFNLGGTSLHVIRLLSRITADHGIELPVAVMFTGGSTIERLAQELRRSDSLPWSPLVPIRANGTRPPLFCFPPAVGNALSYVDLAAHLPDDLPVYGLQAPGLDAGTTPEPNLDKLGHIYLDAIRSVQEEGPYYLAGYCAGSIIATVVATQLREEGQEVALLAALDGGPADVDALVQHGDEATTAAWFAWELGRAVNRDLEIDPDEIRHLTGPDLADAVLAEAVAQGVVPADTAGPQVARLLAVFDSFARAVCDHRLKPYDSPVAVFCATDAPNAEAAIARWPQIAMGPLNHYPVPGDHYTLMRPPNVPTLAAALDKALLEAHVPVPA
ncbi:amino acid adenylation domain-containing protein [Kribbella sp. NBC_00382]|uniref:non-ribosomal peptide synthetase n=1 Tax=Kribbella sp. NBC_00382 TaxID=2975967 RepID=UPI002E1B3B16